MTRTIVESTSGARVRRCDGARVLVRHPTTPAAPRALNCRTAAAPEPSHAPAPKLRTLPHLNLRTLAPRTFAPSPHLNLRTLAPSHFRTLIVLLAPAPGP